MSENDSPATNPAENLIPDNVADDECPLADTIPSLEQQAQESSAEFAPEASATAAETGAGEPPSQDQPLEHAHSSQAEQPQRGWARAVIADGMVQLDCLNRMLLTGIVEPARANAIRANIRERMQQANKEASQLTAGALSPDDLTNFRRDPRLTNLFAPFFSDEYLAELMKDARHGRP